MHEGMFQGNAAMAGVMGRKFVCVFSEESLYSCGHFRRGRNQLCWRRSRRWAVLWPTVGEVVRYGHMKSAVTPSDSSGNGNDQLPFFRCGRRTKRARVYTSPPTRYERDGSNAGCRCGQRVATIADLGRKTSTMPSAGLLDGQRISYTSPSRRYQS